MNERPIYMSEKCKAPQYHNNYSALFHIHRSILVQTFETISLVFVQVPIVVYFFSWPLVLDSFPMHLLHRYAFTLISFARAISIFRHRQRCHCTFITYCLIWCLIRNGPSNLLSIIVSCSTEDSIPLTQPFQAILSYHVHYTNIQFSCRLIPSLPLLQWTLRSLVSWPLFLILGTIDTTPSGSHAQIEHLHTAGIHEDF